MADELGNYLLSFPVSPGQLGPAEVEVPAKGAPLDRCTRRCPRRRELKSSTNVSTKHTSETLNTASLITGVLGIETGKSDGR